ncbi:MAG: PD-(D/E)XK nuclease domain-containing protein, partial [Dysgonamonadaceae bacterium]|nr:PD-(D/E)XK nuclease domain-containing protein [Dysgonamonadaceae bacterium]
HIAEEKYYHSLLLVWLYSMGFKAQGELPTNTGRIDAVWELADTTVITEIKYDKTVAKDRLLEAAMTQIHDRKYYESSLAAGKKILLLAVAFSGKEIGCKIEGLRD